MSRRTAFIVNALALVVVGLGAGWSYIDVAVADGLGSGDVISFMFATLYGVIVPGGIVGEWWRARDRGDEATMLAFERTIPIVTLALLGISTLGAVQR